MSKIGNFETASVILYSAINPADEEQSSHLPNASKPKPREAKQNGQSQ